MVAGIVPRGESAARQHDPEFVTIPVRTIQALIYATCQLRAALRATGPVSAIDHALIDHAAIVSTSVKAAIELSRRRAA
jgi:hypothetical protein